MQEVKTKYKIGQIIYFMNGEVPMKDVIRGYNIFFGKKNSAFGVSHVSESVDKPDIHYFLESTVLSVNEKKAFISKEELIADCFKNL